MRNPAAAAVLSLIILAGPASAASRPTIGTNLNGLAYSSTELPFLDAFKTSGEWISGTRENWKDGRKLDLDNHGWVRSLKPGQVALTLLFSGVAKFSGTLARRYVVEYEGTGTLEYGEQARMVEHGERRDVIEIEGGEGNAAITLTSTDPKDHLRNIRVVPEGDTSKPGEMFNPMFLESLKGYRALRFGIWMLEGDLKEAARPWKARPTRRDARWWVKGAPVEVMVALSNRVHADPWFSIPHAADDHYVRRFADAVKKSLDPRRKVYLEYSNEVWNVNFPQTAYAREKGLALGLSQDPDEAMYRFYAQRSVEIFSIWEQVLGKERLVRVLSFQFDGTPEYGDEFALSFADTRDHVDALSIGPYFGGELGSDAQAIARVKKMTLDELMLELETVSLPNAKAQMLAHAAVARKHGLPMIAYEGGQHLANYSGTEAPEVEALFNAANRDPRMGAFYTRHLNNWAEAGGGLFMHELDCARCDNGGCWGAIEYLTQPRDEAPKYDALLRFIEGR